MAVIDDRSPISGSSGSGSVRTVTGVCHHDCPDSCGWVVTVEDRVPAESPAAGPAAEAATDAHTINAPVPVAVKLRGNPEHPFSQGELCPKVNRYLDRVYSPDRVVTPLRRVGPKGEGRFEPVTWDDALAEIAERWTTIAADIGPEGVAYYQSAGNQSTLSMMFPHRFLHHFGTSLTVGSVCGAVAGAGVGLTYGSGETDDPRELAHAEVVFLWGTNTRLTNRHLWPYVEQARDRGATIVVVDPIRTMTAEAADVFVQPLPGTDVALMLAMMHVLVRDGHVDHDYVSAHAAGFDELAAHVADWTPARAAEICGLDLATVEQVASLYATSRQRPVYLRTLIGAEHAYDGATFFRTMAMLPVLTNAWRHRGGGFSRSVGVYAESALPFPFATELPAGSRRRPLQANHVGRWLTDPDLDPPVRSLLVFGGNPLVTLPNAELLRRGLEREDVFTVVHEQFVTDTARYADLVLPATTQLEQVDVMASWGSPHLTWNHQAIAPLGEAVSNTELFRRLATALELEEPSLHRSDDELLDELFASPGEHASGLTREQLAAMPAFEVEIGPQRYVDGGFATADGKALLANDAAERLGIGRLPDWQPAAEGTAAPADAAARFPYVVYTIKTHTRFLNSSYAHLPGHGGREGEPFVELCSADAAALGVAPGDRVRVWNDRGALDLPVQVSDRVRPGLVAVPFGWHEAAHAAGGSANSLTNDTITAHGGGVAYHDTRVAITPLDS